MNKFPWISLLIAFSIVPSSRGQENSLGGTKEMGEAIANEATRGHSDSQSVEAEAPQLVNKKVEGGAGGQAPFLRSSEEYEMGFVGHPKTSCNRMPIFSTASAKPLDIQKFFEHDPSSVKFEIVPKGARKFIGYQGNNLVFESGPPAKVIFQLRETMTDGTFEWFKWVAEMPDCTRL